MTLHSEPYGQRLTLGVLLIFVGFILSHAMLFAPLHEFVHVVAGWVTGTKLLNISWHGVTHEKFVPAIILAGFPGELAVWAVIVLRSRNLFVKSFFFGVAIDAMYTGLNSADYNTFAEIAMGYRAASTARDVYAILSLTVLTVLSVTLITAWSKERRNANTGRTEGNSEPVRPKQEAGAYHPR